MNLLKFLFGTGFDGDRSSTKEFVRDSKIHKPVMRDEDEGKVVPKIKLKLSDGKETAVVSFTTESYYSLGFFQRIRKVDLSKPIMLGISNSDKNEKVSFCWIKQSGAVIKKEEDFPMPEKKKEGKKEFTSWANPVPEFEKIVKELQEKLKSVQPVEQSSSDKSEEQVEDVKTDLPF